MSPFVDGSQHDAVVGSSRDMGLKNGHVDDIQICVVNGAELGDAVLMEDWKCENIYQRCEVLARVAKDKERFEKFKIFSYAESVIHCTFQS